LSLLVAAHQIHGFEFLPANARAKQERAGIADSERFGGGDVVEDGEDIAMQGGDLVLALEPDPLCHRGVKDDVRRQELGDCICVTAFPGCAQRGERHRDRRGGRGCWTGNRHPNLSRENDLA